jgi:hypothetical protein
MQAGCAGDMPDDVVQLNIHLIEGLLHVLRMVCSYQDKAFSMPPHRTDRTDGLFRSMGCA